MSSITNNTQEQPSYAKYMVRLPVELPGRPGEMDDGTTSVNYPLVKEYVARKAEALLRAEAEHASLPKHHAWHVKDSNSNTTTWWRVDSAGIVRDYLKVLPKPTKKRKHRKARKPKMVWETDSEAEEEVALDIEKEKWEAAAMEKSWADSLQDVESAVGATGRRAKVIFALAALAVYPFPNTPAHWAFWSRNSRRTTAKMVHEIVRAVPKLITVTNNVAWVDLNFAVDGVAVYQKGWHPTTAHPKTKPTKLAPMDVDSLNINGKRVTSDDASLEPGVEPSAKRRKTRSSDGATEQASPPQRKSTRLQNARQIQVAEASPEVPSPTTTDSSTESAEEAVADAEIEPEVEVEVDVVMIGSDEHQAETPVDVAAKTKEAPARKRARKSVARTKRSKRASATRKARSTKKATVTADVPASPSPRTASTLPPEHNLTSSSSLVPLSVGDEEETLSSGSTAVGSPRPIDDSTRVGTPYESPENKEEIEVEMVAAKLETAAAKAKAPVRISDRIRAKKARAGLVASR